LTSQGFQVRDFGVLSVGRGLCRDVGGLL
jgi:hypothetical protein